MLAPSQNNQSPSVHNSKQLSPQRSLPQMRLEAQTPFESAVSEQRLVTNLRKSKKKILTHCDGDQQNSMKLLKNSMRESEKKYYEERQNHQKQVEDWLQSGLQMSRAGSLKCVRHTQICNKHFLYVCLQDSCFDQDKDLNQSQKSIKRMLNQEKKETLNERILCKECINQQLHRGHQICTLAKFEQLVYDFHWASIQATKTVLSKVMQLRHNIDHFLNQLSLNIIQTMTLGMCGQFHIQSSATSHQHKQQQRQNTMSNEQNSKKKSLHPITPTSKQNITEKVQVLSKIGLQTWRELLASKQVCLSANINNILSLKQESIYQQIEDINASCQMLVQSSIHNIKFINQKPNCIFNPDDMSTQKVGLTLDRNKLNSIRDQEDKIQGNQSGIQQSLCSNSVRNCKIAFAQTPLYSEGSRSFCIESIHGIVQVGCVSCEDHKEISTTLNYENYQKLVYGIRIEQNRKVSLLRKGQQTIELPNAYIEDNNIIEFTLHQKQRTLVISKLSHFQKKSKVFRNCKLKDKYYKKQILTILPIEQLKDPKCFIFAGVSMEGDCVSLVENINCYLIENQQPQKQVYSTKLLEEKTDVKKQQSQIYPETYSKVIKKSKNDTLNQAENQINKFRK